MDTDVLLNRLKQKKSRLHNEIEKLQLEIKRTDAAIEAISEMVASDQPELFDGSELKPQITGKPFKELGIAKSATKYLEMVHRASTREIIDALLSGGYKSKSRKPLKANTVYAVLARVKDIKRDGTVWTLNEDRNVKNENTKGPSTN